MFSFDKLCKNIVKSWRLLLGPGATCNGRRFVPHIPGELLSPQHKKGGCLMEYIRSVSALFGHHWRG